VPNLNALLEEIETLKAAATDGGSQKEQLQKQCDEIKADRDAQAAACSELMAALEEQQREMTCLKSAADEQARAAMAADARQRECEALQQECEELRGQLARHAEAAVPDDYEHLKSELAVAHARLEDMEARMHESKEERRRTSKVCEELLTCNEDKYSQEYEFLNQVIPTSKTKPERRRARVRQRWLTRRGHRECFEESASCDRRVYLSRSLPRSLSLARALPLPPSLPLSLPLPPSLPVQRIEALSKERDVLTKERDDLETERDETVKAYEELEDDLTKTKSENSLVLRQEAMWRRGAALAAALLLFFVSVFFNPLIQTQGRRLPLLV
jgi:chromosome segregation ATPase